MRIATRLTTGFSLLIFLFVLCSAVAFSGLNQSRVRMNEVVNLKFKKTVLVNEMGVALRNMLVEIRNMALFSDVKAIEEEALRLQQQKAVYLQNYAALAAMIQENGLPAERELIARVNNDQRTVLELLETAQNRAKNKNFQEIADYLTNVLRPPQQILVGNLNSLTRLQTDEAEQTAQKHNIAVKRLVTVLGALIVLMILAALVISQFTIRKLMQQLGDDPAVAQRLAATIASGDLTKSIILRNNNSHSLLASLDSMQAGLRDLVSQIKDSSASVVSATNGLVKNNSELSSRTEQQSAALQETAANMEELTITVSSNTENAKHTAHSARKAAKLAQTGESDIQHMTDSMDEISLSAGKINDITGVIEGIAFQTSILALNAAVEAARAGEQGRGFAVVANEVRTLAQRSNEAAKEIKAIIEHTVTQVENGVTVAKGTSQRMMEIVKLVGGLADAMDNISLASSEQKLRISQISVAVSQMDSVTQSNAMMVEQSARASQNLSKQANVLSKAIEKFKV